MTENCFADEAVVVGSYEGIREYLKPGADSYVVVMTLGYEYDKIVIRALRDSEFEYLGVLGSRAKMGKLLAELRDEGINNDWLERIRTPVGFDINSRTPDEIAVSICAELISVKNSKGENDESWRQGT